MRLYFVQIAFVIYILNTIATYGQYTDVINSNRPGVSQSAFAVGVNVFQFETGVFSINEEHDLLNFETEGFGADFVLRYGLLFEALELNLNVGYQSDTFTDNSLANAPETSRTDFRNVTLGAKYLIYDPYKDAEEDKPNLYSWKANQRFNWKKLIPAVAVFAGANFDTQDNPFIAPDTEGFSPRVAVITQNNFKGGWVFVTNFMLDRIGTDSSDFQYILTLTHAFNRKLVVFGETQGISGDFNSDNLFRFGGAYLFSPNFQLDTAVAFNNKNTPSVFNITLGASYRLDFHKDKKIRKDFEELEEQTNL